MSLIIGKIFSAMAANVLPAAAVRDLLVLIFALL